MLDRVTDRNDMREELITIVRMLMGMPPAVKGNLPKPDEAETADAAQDASAVDAEAAAKPEAEPKA